MVKRVNQARVSGDDQREPRAPAHRGQTKPSARREPRVGNLEPARPWRQWHSAARPQETAPLEVTSPKKPQWGRFIYFAIIVTIAAIAAKAAYVNIFWFNADGLISGKQHNVASSQTVSVEEILVTPSERVSEGQLLVRLNSPELVQSLSETEANIARIQSDMVDSEIRHTGNAAELRARMKSLEAEMESLEAQYYTEQRQIDSLRQLVQAGATQRGHLDQLEIQHSQTWANYKRVDAELESVRNQIASLQKSQQSGNRPELAERLRTLTDLHRNIQKQLERLDLKAPIAGMVAQVPSSKGDVLTAGQPAVVLVDKSELRGYLYFPAAAQDKLHQGMVIPVTKADGSTIDLEVTKVYPSMESVPPQFRAQYEANSSAVVVEAMPVDGRPFPDDLTSGTPVKGRIPRWSLTSFLDRGIQQVDEKVDELGKQVESATAAGNTSAGGSSDTRQPDTKGAQ